MPHIRIFPCSQEEFVSEGAFQTWLMTSLKAGGGTYLLRSDSRVADLAPGSIVLFRYEDHLVGEGVVREYVKEAHTSRTLAGEERQYEARVTFALGSIRMFTPPMKIEELQQIVGEAIQINSRMPYYAIRSWDTYPRLLAAHIGRAGAFM